MPEHGHVHRPAAPAEDRGRQLEMNRSPSEGAALARELAALRAADPASGTSPLVVICPPFPALDAVGRALAGPAMRLGARTACRDPRRVHGRSLGSDARARGCTWVIVGHSERRHGMGETDALVAAKLRAAQRDSFTPDRLRGRDLAEREGGHTEAVLVRQVATAYNGLAADAARATAIAYEPLWAIGRARWRHPSRRATPTRGARDARPRARSRRGPAAAILYAVSVNAGNARRSSPSRRGRRPRGRRVARGRVVLEDRERGERRRLRRARF
jgi:triosephosphate isomerase